MEFWGIEVKAGESVKVVPDDGSIIHVSQAALGEQKGKVKGLIPLRVKIEGKQFILGSLSSESIPHVTFDLVFHTEFELSHDSNDGSVYFLGYKGDVDDDDEMPHDFNDSEDESMDVEDELLAVDDATLKKLQLSTNGVKSDNKQKVTVKEPGKKEDDDGSSDEDEDDDDDSSDDELPAIGEEDDGSDDDDDDSSEEETPKEIKGGKKRIAESAPVIPSLAKKTKVESKPAKPAAVKAAPSFNKSNGQAQKFQANKAKKGGK